MQGLQERLKNNILSDCPHVVVEASPLDIDDLLAIDGVNALAPFIQGEVMLQYQDKIIMATLQGMDYRRLYVSPAYALVLGYTSEQRDFFQPSANEPDVMTTAQPDAQKRRELMALDPRVRFNLNADYEQESARSVSLKSERKIHFIIRTPTIDSAGYSYGYIHTFPSGTYSLAMNAKNIAQLGMDFMGANAAVRLTSTRNARYTPFGLAPTQRKFQVVDVIDSIDNASIPIIIGNYEDVRKFFRIPEKQMYYRLFLKDPFDIDKVRPALEGKFNYWDWSERYGDFFKAVALEKITMSVMLCLIIIVAAFNILSSLTMVVSSRVTEIAILKTLGMTRFALLRVFLWVGMSASILGSALGVILGIPLALHAQTILQALGISIVRGELPIDINGWNILLIVSMCLLVSILCTIYPAYHASNTDPVKNLVSQ